jgi:3-vinyl bacteriochlorophyllide hydratase
MHASPFERPRNFDERTAAARSPASSSLTERAQAWLDSNYASLWPSQAGIPLTATPKPPAQLYTPQQRARRDASPWTMVQAVLAPLQFAVFLVSLGLIVRYLVTGEGYGLATGSILVKTACLYLIMLTGAVWEKEVFGQWLFAPAFFWEDVFSFLVIGLQTAYVVALVGGYGTPTEQMMIAMAAYAAYAINATQFLLKLRAARLQGAGPGLATGSGA